MAEPSTGRPPSPHPEPTAASPGSRDGDPLAYLVALDELDEILGELEDPSVDVDRLAERVKRASELIALCRERISAARMEVEQIVTEVDGPFDPS